MRVLLVQHAAENCEAYPLGLGYVASILKNAGHAVSFLDLALERGDPAPILVERARRDQADALGFTLMTPQYAEYLDLARDFRTALPGVTVVAGGPHPSALPEETLREGAVDVAVLGEAESTAAPLFAALERGRGLETVPGIAFLDGDRRCRLLPPADPVPDLDAIPLPAWDLMHPAAYRGRLRGRRMANVLSSRGCPFHCLYCQRGPASGRRFRARSPENVLAELRRLHAGYGLSAFCFADDIFTLQGERTRRLCAALEAEPYDIRWICETRADCVDEDLLAAMKRAGCLAIDIGVESGSPEILARLRKKISKDRIRRAFRDCHRIGMPTRAFFMLGTPWETEDTIRETIDFARELKPTISIFFLAMPYPGTALREAFIDAGWPLPADWRSYRHFVEGRRFQQGPAGGAAAAPQVPFVSACRRATRAVVLAQIRDLRSYPELLRAYLTRYTPGETAARIAQRAWGSLGRSRSAGPAGLNRKPADAARAD
ncbi:MAG: radical SAM protein [Candidatus Eisenbacteria bacterium]